MMKMDLNLKNENSTIVDFLKEKINKQLSLIRQQEQENVKKDQLLKKQTESLLFLQNLIQQELSVIRNNLKEFQLQFQSQIISKQLDQSNLTKIMEDIFMQQTKFNQMKFNLQEQVNINKQLKLELINIRGSLKYPIQQGQTDDNEKLHIVIQNLNQQLNLKETIINDQNTQMDGLLKLNQSTKQEIKYLNQHIEPLKSDQIKADQKDYCDDVKQFIQKQDFNKQKCDSLKQLVQQKDIQIESLILELHDSKIERQILNDVIIKSNKQNLFKDKQNILLRRELSNAKEFMTSSQQSNTEHTITQFDIDNFSSSNIDINLEQIDSKQQQINHYKNQIFLLQEENQLLKLQQNENQPNNYEYSQNSNEQLLLLRKIYNNMHCSDQSLVISLQIQNNQLQFNFIIFVILLGIYKFWIGKIFKNK